MAWLLILKQKELKKHFILVVDQKVQIYSASNEAVFLSCVIGSTTYTQSKPRL